MEREHSIDSILDSLGAVKRPEAPERSQQEYYSEATDSLQKFGDALKHLKGKNTELMTALATFIDRSLCEDLYEQGLGNIDDEEWVSLPGSYESFQKALATIEQYIKENKPTQ